MPRINNLQSTHFDQMPTNLVLVERVCSQLRMIWKDKEILVWKKSVVSEGPAIMLLSDAAACLMSPSQINALKINLENCFKKETETAYEVVLKPEAPCEIAVQIRMLYLGQMSQTAVDAGISHDISTKATKEEEEIFILSISAAEHVAQAVEDETLAVLNNCMQQLLEFNRLYYLLYQNSILLKKFRHDFRTPLTSVSMIGGILLTDENEELQQMGQMLHTATEKLDKLLKDFKSKLEL